MGGWWTGCDEVDSGRFWGMGGRRDRGEMYRSGDRQRSLTRFPPTARSEAIDTRRVQKSCSTLPEGS